VYHATTENFRKHWALLSLGMMSSMQAPNQMNTAMSAAMGSAPAPIPPQPAQQQMPPSASGQIKPMAPQHVPSSAANLQQAQKQAHMQSLPIRAYLDQTVVPLFLDGKYFNKYNQTAKIPNPCVYLDLTFSLLSFVLSTTSGMSELVKERPPDPVEWLAAYLLRNNPSRQMHSSQGSGGGGVPSTGGR